MTTIGEAMTIAVDHHGAGRLAEAETIYRQILTVDPNHPDALHLLGVIAQQAGRNDLAIELITRALGIMPTVPEVHSNLGNSLKALGRLSEAEASYKAALALKPEFPDALYNLAAVQDALGDFDHAVASLDRALALRPDFIGAHYNRANTLRKLGRLDDAVAGYRMVLALDANHVDARNNLGSCLHDLGQPGEAIACYRIVLDRAPGFAIAHNNIGNALRELGVEADDPALLDEAMASFHKALAIQPDYADAHNGLGSVLQAQGRVWEAIDRFKIALAHGPDVPQIHNNLGFAYKAVGMLDQAASYYDKALALQPDFADAHFNRSLVHFLTGHLREAWLDYEWRWKRPALNKKRPFPQPWWEGQPLDRKTVLIWGEQGLADEIMGLTMVADAMARAEHCIVECDRRLVDLVGRTFPAVTVVPRETPPDQRATPAHYQIPALGLSRIFRNDFKEFTAVPTLLTPDPAKAAHWKRWLDGLPPGPRIGLSWRGRWVTSQRSQYFPALDLLAPILRIPGVIFVNLQYDESAADIETIRSLTGVVVHSPLDLDLTNDLDGVVALMSGLDAVVGPATAVVDLAGAVGRPTWTYTYYLGSAERLGCGRDRVPWYPSVRIESHEFGMDWAGVIGRVADSFGQFILGQPIGGDGG